MYKTKEQYNKYMKEYMLKRYHDRRKIGINLLGNKCVNCGTTEDLQFDHINYKEKSINLALKLHTISFDDYLCELKKCQLLCFDCHVEKSREEIREQKLNKYKNMPG